MPPVLRHRWLALRNRLLARPGFQRWAARFPLTRPIARAQARGLFDLVAGFVYSQVLAACVELDLFAPLAERPRTLAEIAAHAHLNAEAAERLLKAATALDLVARVADRFTLGARGAALIGNPGVIAMIRHHGLLYADLADPVGLLRETRTGALGAYWPYARAERPGAAAIGDIAPYSTLMAASQPMIAAQVLGAYDFSRHRRLLDIGGGAGAFLIAVGQHHPALELVAFDLPAVAGIAETAFAAAGLGVRARAIGGDMFAGPLPDGADIVSLVRVLHDHDDTAAAALLARIRAILPQGGTLLIAEPMAGAGGKARVGDAYFGLYLLAMGSGRARTAAEIGAMCRAAGFARARPRATAMPLSAGMIVATA